MNQPYLWDRSGDTDPFIHRLETALRDKQSQVRARAARRSNGLWRVGLASLAAAALIVWLCTAEFDVDNAPAKLGASPAIVGETEAARDAAQSPAVARTDRPFAVEVPAGGDAPPAPSPAADSSEAIPGAPAAARD